MTNKKVSKKKTSVKKTTSTKRVKAPADKNSKEGMAALAKDLRKGAKKVASKKKASVKKKAPEKKAPSKAAVAKAHNDAVEKNIKGPTVIGKLQMLKLNPANVVIVAGFNPRIDKGDLSELMASIKTHGVKVPIRVRKVAKHFELIDGERRLLSTLKLGLKEIPAIEEKGEKTEEELIALALIHNDGKPLAPVEEAEAYRRLIKAGWTAKKISAQTGKRMALVKNRLALISAHPDVVAAVKAGKLSLSMGTQIAKKARGKKGKQKRMVSKATKSKEGKKTVALQMGKAPLKVKLEKQVLGLQNRMNKLVVIVNKKRAKKDRLPKTLVAQHDRFNKAKDREVRAAFIAGGIYAITQGLASANAKKGKGSKKINVRVKGGRSPKRA